MCAGNLAQTCGKDKFPREALEQFTKFGLECLAQQDAKLELRETAFGYFSEISKIMRSEMAPIFPTIFAEILKSITNEDGVKEGDTKKKVTEGGFSLDSDEEDEALTDINIDVNFLDEKSSAIHTLGNLALYCPKIMMNHLEDAVNAILELGSYLHENIRYHVCLTLTQITFGLLKLYTSKDDADIDSDNKFKWEAGVPLKE